MENLQIIVPYDDIVLKQENSSYVSFEMVEKNAHPWIKESLRIIHKHQLSFSDIFNLNNAYQLRESLEQQERNTVPARSAYSFFFKDKRISLKHVHPDKNGFEIAKMLASVWRNLPSSVKKSYYEKEMDDQQRYNKEIEEIVRSRLILERMISNMEYKMNH